MGRRAQLLRHQADVFIGLVIPGWNAGVAHQGTNIRNGAARLRVLFQPGDELANQIAPTHAQTAGTDLPQQIHGSLGEHLIGVILILAILHQDTAPNGAGQPQPLQQAGRLGPPGSWIRISTTPSSRASLSIRLTSGRDTPSSAAISLLLLVLQVIPPGHMGQPSQLLRLRHSRRLLAPKFFGLFFAFPPNGNKCTLPPFGPGRKAPAEPGPGAARDGFPPPLPPPPTPFFPHYLSPPL